MTNNKYELVYNSELCNRWSPENYIGYASYFFSGEKYDKLKRFPKEMSDQPIPNNS